MDYETVKQHFAGLFAEPDYDGSYHHGEWPENDTLARQSFLKLTDGCIIWTQVHGDFKNAVKRAAYEPYPHWPALYRCCRDVLKAHAELNSQYVGATTCARTSRWQVSTRLPRTA